MPFATINGIKVNYQIQGSGPFLLMFAGGGFGAEMSMWTAQGGSRIWKGLDAINALSAHFTTIAYDRRETGLSGGRIEQHNWDCYVAEAKGLLDLANAKEAYVLGSCMGASLALALAVREPARCKGLLLHWPVGGYQWMLRGRGMFQKHIDFVRANGLQAVVARAKANDKNFWLDPESGPWASPIARDDGGFVAEYLKQVPESYLAMCERTRDSMFNDTMPFGATGEELMKMQTPALIMAGADSRHTTSCAWAINELMPHSELWDVRPPNQTDPLLFEQLLRIKTIAP
jgi:pimeloyl-ACP methyl ester carboxylesterase